MHIEKEDRNVKYLKNIVNKIAKSIYETQEFLCKKYSNLKRNIDSANVTYITTQELEDKYPDKTPKEREYLICNENKGRLIFLMQIGGKLKSGISHDGRSTDYDD
jgi:aspartate--ammonia ligase